MLMPGCHPRSCFITSMTPCKTETHSGRNSCEPLHSSRKNCIGCTNSLCPGLRRPAGALAEHATYPWLPCPHSLHGRSAPQCLGREGWRVSIAVSLCPVRHRLGRREWRAVQRLAGTHLLVYSAGIPLCTHRAPAERHVVASIDLA